MTFHGNTMNIMKEGELLYEKVSYFNLTEGAQYYKGRDPIMKEGELL